MINSATKTAVKKALAAIEAGDKAAAAVACDARCDRAANLKVERHKGADKGAEVLGERVQLAHAIWVLALLHVERTADLACLERDVGAATYHLELLLSVLIWHWPKLVRRPPCGRTSTRRA